MSSNMRCEDCGGRGHLECEVMPMDGGPRYSERPTERDATSRTAAEILADHRPAVISGQPAGCRVCLGTIAWPCDAVLAARLAQESERELVGLRSVVAQINRVIELGGTVTLRPREDGQS